MIQWLASEKAGKSIVPTAFWYLSIGGSAILLIYAVHKRDPVFILAYLPNAFVYMRNLQLIKRHEDGPTRLARGAESGIADAEG
ncbi:MAG: lipid-A-disaccharide synthase N-terminal domain-containing protein [Deltaproteobacteria bacterium]|nr:lipid-A-disaccharide synthase N-terminal domain-containing protein [Deltaproteobacteria bacterium]